MTEVDAALVRRKGTERMLQETGLRNRIVHEYESIDDQRVLDAVGEAIRDYGEYVAAVDAG